MTTSPLRILIVDDNVDTTRMMRALLKREGYETETAFDGSGAIEAARAFRPDAVLLDLTLPDMSGSEVARELKDIPELGRCVFVSVSGYDDARTLGPPSPFEHQFKKPVDHEALLKYLSGLQTSQASACLPNTALA